MAREIHDTLAQGLTGIVTQLEAAQQPAATGRARAADRQRERLARDSLAEARRSVQALRPEPLEAARLPDALADEVARVVGDQRRAGRGGDHRRPAGAAPGGRDRPCCASRRRRWPTSPSTPAAARVGLTLSYMEDVVTLDVRDDGAGFDPPESGPTRRREPGHAGFGLIAMRQRVARLAGQLEIESEPGEGTAVSASLSRRSPHRRSQSEPTRSGC